MIMNIAIKKDSTSFAASLMSALLLATLLELGVSTLSAGVLPSSAKPYGHAYSEWSAAWWQWALAIPADHNPIVDQTGEDAAVGQSGNVWFLAGNTGGTSERAVTVPAGKALLIPVLNQIYLGFPCDDRNLPGCEIDQAFEEANDVAGLLAFITPSMDGATVACEVDGNAVRNLAIQRVESSGFYSVTLGANNVFGYPAGPYHPCVDVGYYVMLAPLSVGDHTLHFAAANSDGSFALDVTYQLTVK
jgi:hypothetical protein